MRRRTILVGLAASVTAPALVRAQSISSGLSLDDLRRGAGGRPTQWNPNDKTAGTTLSNGNLTAQASTNSNGVRTTNSHSSGKWYWETTVVLFSSASTGVGLGNANAILSTVGATPTNAAVLYSSGNIWVNGSNVGSTGGVVAGGSIICNAVDLDANLYWIRNGAAGNWNNNVSNNPATGVGGISIASIAGPALPTFGLLGLNFTASAATVTGNFGGTAFSGAVPGGFFSGF